MKGRKLSLSQVGHPRLETLEVLLDIGQVRGELGARSLEETLVSCDRPFQLFLDALELGESLTELEGYKRRREKRVFRNELFMRFERLRGKRKLA